MSNFRPATQIDGLSLRLALLYGGIFLALGIRVPFLPVWLNSKGLDPDAIELVFAAASLGRLAAVAVSAQLADRFAARRATLIAVTVTTAVCYGLAGLGGSLWTTLGAVFVALVASSPALPLTNAYAVKGLGDRGRAFGPVRLGFGHLRRR